MTVPGVTLHDEPHDRLSAAERPESAADGGAAAADGPRRGIPAWALLIGAVAVAILMPPGFTPLEAGTRLVLTVLSFLILICAALLLVSSTSAGVKGLQRWRLGPWYLLWSAVIFGLASLQWLSPSLQATRGDLLALSSVIAALVLLIIALAAWTVGYRLGPSRPVTRAVSRGQNLVLGGRDAVVRGKSMPILLYGLGSIARLAIAVQTGQFGYVGDPQGAVAHALPTTGPLHVASMLAVFAVGGAALRAFDPRIRGGRATLWILVAIELPVGMLTGMKESFILLLLAILIPYGAMRGRLPLRLILVGALAFFTIAVPFNAAYREAVRAGGPGDPGALSWTTAVTSAPEIISRLVNSPQSDETADEARETLLYRVRMIDSVAVVKQHTPSAIAYQNPADYLSAPVLGLVPRAVWPDKPILAAGYEFNQEYYGQPSWIYSSAAVTPVGDLYRHGGWLVVVIGMLLLGAGCRLFDTLVQPERDPRSLCFLLVFFPIVVKSEMDYYLMLVNVPVGLVTAILGARLMCRPVARAGAIPE